MAWPGDGRGSRTDLGVPFSSCLSTSRHHVGPGSHHGREGGPHRGLVVQTDQGGRAEKEDPGGVPRGARPAEAFLQGQAGKPAPQAACPPSTFVLAQSRRRTYTLPPSPRPASLLRGNLKCLSQEQRLCSQIDTPDRQLALESVVFGLLNSPCFF